MIKIKVKSEVLDLPSGFSIEMEDSSPIFNDIGSQSIPATVPATGRNIRLLDAPHRLDTGTDPNNPEQYVDVIDGAYMRRGIMNVTDAGREEGITFNIGFDNSTAYAVWSKMKLSELSGLPTFNAPEGPGYRIDNLLDELYRIYCTPDSQSDDFAVFPIAINNESIEQDNVEHVYWEVMNVAGEHGFAQPNKVNRIIDGEITELAIPEGYMVSPFIRVWRVLELIFATLNLKILSNPFRENPDLSRLVVLNNAADSVCRAEIKYSDLMPDSTVEDFLHALWVRFGLVYNIDNNAGTVRLELLKDIINRRNARTLDEYAAGTEKIVYEERQYVKLAAGTSIEGAAPSHERFEDFVKGLDVSKVRMGNHVSQWQNTGTTDDPHWDGDWNDERWDNYDPWEDPDWSDPDDDHNDYDEYSARSAVMQLSGSSVSVSNEPFLAREFVTGQWFKLDATNGKVCQSSSSFFNWDPQPEGLTPLELVSEDEFVPVSRVSTVDLGAGNPFNNICPLYLFGSRHYHSYIKGCDETEARGDRTPLAFMFAYNVDNKTIGRLTPEGDNGASITLDDGTKPSVSLLFQFKDGLFAKFWADYDEILRHGNRSVEVRCRINKLNLSKLDFSDVYMFKGVRVLIDSISYSLPSTREVTADLRLRTIQTHGHYNISEEQNVPDFAAAARHLDWFLYSETFGAALNTDAVRAEAARIFKENTGYQEHGTIGNNWYVGARGAIYKNITRIPPTWQTDPTKSKPTSQGQQNIRNYTASLTYDIYEIHDLSQGPDDDNWVLEEFPIGEVSVEVEYHVVLYSKWVTD